MSRLDLDVIQSELKTAIQNHQILVSRLQLHPQDMALKTQLHNIQKEIMLMSQKQKSVVQKLRKDLIERKPDSNENHDPKNSSSSLVKKPSSPPEPIESQCDTKTKPPPPTACDVPEKPLRLKNVSSPLRVPQFLPNNCRTPVPQNNNNNNITPDIKLGISKLNDAPVSVPPRKQPYTKAASYKEKRNSEALPEDPELKKKLEFLASIRLFPPDTLKEMQSKRTERKRKSTNNPNFAYGFELERRPRLSNYLGTDYFGAQKPKSRSSSWKADGPSPNSSRSNTPETTTVVNGTTDTQTATKENRLQDTVCSVCNLGGQLLPCDTCSGMFHLQCLSPPLATVPESPWNCKKCQEAHHRSALSLAAVTTYIATKTGKEEEKRKLLKRSTELLQEKTNLENRTKELNEILARQGIQKQELIDINRKAQQSVESLKTFVKIVQSS